MLIRAIHPNDAEQFLQLCLLLDQETKYMRLEPGERNMNIEKQRERIADILSHDNQMIFVVEHDDRLIGYLRAAGGDYRRTRHSVYIVVGLLQAFTSQGIGTTLFQTLEAWARSHKLHRLELKVMVHNLAGIALYKKCGFVIEGTRKGAFYIDKHYADEYYMARLLDEKDMQA
jgi:RimJ/RimL family protein N-acetyltransferase